MTSYIYFIQAQDDGPVKIGTTRFDPRRRMVKIQCDCPWPVRLLGTIFGTASQEKKIQTVLRPWRIQGEWFSPHPIVMAAVNEAMRCGARPYGKYNRSPKYDKGPKYNHPLCRFRHENGITLRQLGAQAGLAFPFLAKLERGEMRPGAKTVKILSEITGLTPADLRPDLALIFGEGAANGF